MQQSKLTKCPEQEEQQEQEQVKQLLGTSAVGRRQKWRLGTIATRPFAVTNRSEMTSRFWRSYIFQNRVIALMLKTGPEYKSLIAAGSTISVQI